MTDRPAAPAPSAAPQDNAQDIRAAALREAAAACSALEWTANGGQWVAPTKHDCAAVILALIEKGKPAPHCGHTQTRTDEPG